MSGKERLNIVKKAIECCLVKASCHPCPFYQEPVHGKPGRCMGMKNAGNLLLSYLDDIERELENGKKGSEIS